MDKKVRILAFYLPQFHPISENDEWWGKGFTEWTNVAKAKPLFKGHDQPKIPTDLGFYDLRVPETREAQAKLAAEHGIEGFVYWHYWFAGKRLLEAPFNEVLKSGNPDFPFCLAWANETWTGVWHGLNNKILIAQEYPGKEDYINHFNAILGAFKDKRYIKVDGKPVFYIYRPEEIPNIKDFFEIWNSLAVANGLKGIHFIAPCDYSDNNAQKMFDLGYNAIHSYRFGESYNKLKSKTIFNKIKRKFFKSFSIKNKTMLNVLDYSRFIKDMTTEGDKNLYFYPTIFPSWDNSPRSGERAIIMENSNPGDFKKHVHQVFSTIKNKPIENRIVFLKSWNEWAEGNYIEPDLKFGLQYLEVIKNEIDSL